MHLGESCIHLEFTQTVANHNPTSYDSFGLQCCRIVIYQPKKKKKKIVGFWLGFLIGMNGIHACKL